MESSVIVIVLGLCFVAACVFGIAVILSENKKDMKNFPVKVNNKEYWISRSVAVAVNVYGKINGVDCILANKRGKGLPNHVGEWNAISGYIDFDETLEQCCVREVYEECGIDISNCKLELYKFEDSPSRENQVILFRYFTWLTDADKQTPSAENCEPDEVEEIKWIPISELDNYKWTSEHHKELIFKIYSEHYDLDY